MRQLLILESFNDLSNNRPMYNMKHTVIFEHFETHVKQFTSIHRKPYGNIWGLPDNVIDELQSTSSVYKFLPAELLDLVVICTICTFLKNHMFKKAAKLISSKRYYITTFFKIMFGDINANKHCDQFSKISRTLMFIDLIHTQVMKSVNTAGSLYIVNEVTIKRRDCANTVYPWSLVLSKRDRYFMNSTILEIQAPSWSQNHLGQFSFSIGSTYGDMIWASGKYNFSTGLFEATKVMWPIIPLMFCRDDVDENVFLDLGKDWQAMTEWANFGRFYKMIYGETTTLLFATSQQANDNEPYSLFYF